MDLSKLTKKLSEGSTGIYSEVLSESTIATITEYIPSDCFDLNRIATGDLYKLIPNGKMVCIVAPEGTGKTILLMNIIKHAQWMGYLPIVAETENAYDKKWVERWGVDTSSFLYNYVAHIEDFRRWVLNTEKILEKPENYGLPENQKFFLGLDSLGGLTMRKFSSDKTKDKNWTKIDQGLLQRHIKEAFKMVQRLCAIHKVPFVFTNHFSANPNAGLFVQEEKMVGGKFPRHAAWMTFYLTKSKVKDEDTKVVTGTHITAKSMKNRQYPPFQTALIDLSFQDGINSHAGLADLGVELDIFQKDGPRYVIEEKKLYGVDILRKAKEIYTHELLSKFNEALSKRGYSEVKVEDMEYENESRSNNKSPRKRGRKTKGKNSDTQVKD